MRLHFVATMCRYVNFRPIGIFSSKCRSTVRLHMSSKTQTIRPTGSFWWLAHSHKSQRRLPSVTTSKSPLLKTRTVNLPTRLSAFLPKKTQTFYLPRSNEQLFQQSNFTFYFSLPPVTPLDPADYSPLLQLDRTYNVTAEISDQVVQIMKIQALTDEARLLITRPGRGGLLEVSIKILST